MLFQIIFVILYPKYDNLKQGKSVGICSMQKTQNITITHIMGKVCLLYEALADSSNNEIICIVYDFGY